MAHSRLYRIRHAIWQRIHIRTTGALWPQPWGRLTTPGIMSTVIGTIKGTQRLCVMGVSDFFHD